MTCIPPNPRRVGYINPIHGPLNGPLYMGSHIHQQFYRYFLAFQNSHNKELNKILKQYAVYVLWAKPYLAFSRDICLSQSRSKLPSWAFFTCIRKTWKWKNNTHSTCIQWTKRISMTTAPRIRNPSKWKLIFNHTKVKLHTFSLVVKWRNTIDYWIRSLV